MATNSDGDKTMRAIQLASVQVKGNTIAYPRVASKAFETSSVAGTILEVAEVADTRGRRGSKIVRLELLPLVGQVRVTCLVREGAREGGPRGKEPGMSHEAELAFLIPNESVAWSLPLDSWRAFEAERRRQIEEREKLAAAQARAGRPAPVADAPPQTEGGAA